MSSPIAGQTARPIELKFLWTEGSLCFCVVKSPPLWVTLYIVKLSIKKRFWKHEKMNGEGGEMKNDAKYLD